MSVFPCEVGSIRTNVCGRGHTTELKGDEIIWRDTETRGVACRRLDDYGQGLALLELCINELENGININVYETYGAGCLRCRQTSTEMYGTAPRLA